MAVVTMPLETAKNRMAFQKPDKVTGLCRLIFYLNSCRTHFHVIYEYHKINSFFHKGLFFFLLFCDFLCNFFYFLRSFSMYSLLVVTLFRFLLVLILLYFCLSNNNRRETVQWFDSNNDFHCWERRNKRTISRIFSLLLEMRWTDTFDVYVSRMAEKNVSIS